MIGSLDDTVLNARIAAMVSPADTMAHHDAIITEGWEKSYGIGNQ